MATWNHLYKKKNENSLTKRKKIMPCAGAIWSPRLWGLYSSLTVMKATAQPLLAAVWAHRPGAELAAFCRCNGSGEGGSGDKGICWTICSRRGDQLLGASYLFKQPCGFVVRVDQRIEGVWGYIVHMYMHVRSALLFWFCVEAFNSTGAGRLSPLWVCWYVMCKSKCCMCRFLGRNDWPAVRVCVCVALKFYSILPHHRAITRVCSTKFHRLAASALSCTTTVWKTTGSLLDISMIAFQPTDSAIIARGAGGGGFLPEQKRKETHVIFGQQFAFVCGVYIVNKIFKDSCELWAQLCRSLISVNPLYKKSVIHAVLPVCFLLSDGFFCTMPVCFVMATTSRWHTYSIHTYSGTDDLPSWSLIFDQLGKPTVPVIIFTWAQQFDWKIYRTANLAGEKSLQNKVLSSDKSVAWFVSVAKLCQRTCRLPQQFRLCLGNCGPMLSIFFFLLKCWSR